MSTHKALARRWFEEVWNRRDDTAIGQMFAADGIAHGLGPDGQDLVGPAGFVHFHRAFLDAFRDLRIELDDLIEEDDKIAIRWHATGTHSGHGLGVEPNGKAMNVTGTSIVRVRDGLIVEAWNNFDVLGMHQQLGTLAQLIAPR
jgi:steroid delta-isomerase-like uncharacterized protein